MSTNPLTVNLMTRGYFPDRVIPPVNSLAIGSAIPEILAFAVPKVKNSVKKKMQGGMPRSRAVAHSVPKRKHLRRPLAIPHPLIQTVLADEIANAWKDLKKFCSQSPLALSVPTLGTTRAIEPEHSLNEQPIFRAEKSVGARYLLKADIARYYPSIYTHSIPWALHGKQQARADKVNALVGNRLDLWTRESQDKQTGGIPIGPDTSFVIGEIIGSAIDKRLCEKLRHIHGARSMDDYYLYFPTLSDAERCIAALHEIAQEFELDINDSKTEIISLPDALEPKWKSDLRTSTIREQATPQAFDLLTLFDRAFEYSKEFPSDSVLTYAAKQTLGADIKGDNWGLCESLLLRAALAEPTLLSVLGEVYLKFEAFHTDGEPLTRLLLSLCDYHAPLRQGNEVAWALWLAREKEITIPRAVADVVARLDDDVVALMALDMRESGFFDASDCAVWGAHINASELYEEHWLVAYEAAEQGWLSSGADHVGNDEFFGILRKHAVRFYSSTTAPTSSGFRY